MRYIIEGLDSPTIDEEGKYQVKDTQSTKTWNIVMHNDTYYNQALDKDLAKEWTNAANMFPEAIRLLKEVAGVLKELSSNYSSIYADDTADDVYEFLTKLEEDEKDSK